MPDLYICPKCLQRKLEVDSEKGIQKCKDPSCGFGSSKIAMGSAYQKPLKMKDYDEFIAKQLDKYDPLGIKGLHQDVNGTTRDILKLQTKILAEKQICSVLPERFPQMPGFLPVTFEPDEGERKVMYWGSFAISSAIIIGFLWVAGTLLGMPWQTFKFGFLFWGFIIARAVDILTTFFVLGYGAVETNPLSDPYDITRLVRLHVPQIIIVPILAYFLGKWTPWAGNGFLLWMVMMSLRAGLSNVTQLLHTFILSTSLGEVKGLFYINAVVCSVIICGAAYFAIPYFLNYSF